MKSNRISIGRVGLVAWIFASGTGFSHGDIHVRIAAVTARISAAPLDAQLLVQRAELYRQHEEWHAALADYQAARKLDSTLETDLPRGRVLLESGDAQGSLAVLDGFLQRHPDEPQAWVCRARCLVKLGRRPEALSDYREALKRTDRPEPDLVLEFADALAAQGCHEEAVQVLDAGIEKLGSIPAFVLRSIELEMAAKNFQGALARVEAMRQSAPRPEPWMARRASILARQGRIRESRAAWQELVERLASLPAAQRGSHAMSILFEESRQALASLASQPDVPQPSPAP